MSPQDASELTAQNSAGNPTLRRRGPGTRHPMDLAPGRGPLPGASLAAAMLGFFVVALDAQIVNVALTEVGSDLGGGLAGLQWVVTGYTLSFSSLLLFAGTFSDRLGARRTYAMGMTIFVLASVACGIAPSLWVIVAARVFQGIGAALITPTSLALIRAAYAAGPDRTKAVAYWALGGSVAAAAGPILGGLLAQLDWRIIFYVNLPVGVVALALLTRVAESSRQPQAFDLVGQGSALVALAGLTYGVIEGGSGAYSDADVQLALVLAVVGGVGFIVAQARGRHPMLPFELFRHRVVAVSLTVAFFTMAGFYGLVFLQSLYFQQVRGASPLQTGLLFLPMTVLIAALNPVSARAAIRFGSRTPIVVGQVMMVLGLVALALAPLDQPRWAIALLMIPVGVGGSLTVPPVTSMLLDSVPGSNGGTASGVLNTARQVGGSMGVATTGAVIAHLGGFVDGLRISLSALAVLVTITAALSLRLPFGKARS